MIVFNIDVMLARRKMSLTELSHRGGNKLCRALDCQPGDLLEYRPGPENDNFEE